MLRNLYACQNSLYDILIDSNGNIKNLDPKHILFIADKKRRKTRIHLSSDYGRNIQLNLSELDMELLLN